MRDLYLGKAPKDYDLATSALPDEVASLFRHAVMAGARHGTVIVSHGGFTVDITTFRGEGSYSDMRRPDSVWFHDDIEQDLARRDFTVNSMAWRPESGLLDPYGGLDDLRQGVLRCVGDPDERFREDALRMLRSIRFSVQLDLKPEKTLLEAAGRNHTGILNLSRERIWREINLILLAPFPACAHYFSGKNILAAAMKMLLGEDYPDAEVTALFGKIIDSGWPQEMLPALLWLTANMAEVPAARWRSRLRILRTSSGTRQQILLFMKKCRLSRRQAVDATAGLYWCSLRFLFPQNLNVYRMRILLRLLARRFRLDSAAALSAALLSGEFFREYLARTGILAPDLSGDSILLREAAATALTLEELPVSGKDMQIAGITAGRSMRIYLERLLSMVIRDPQMNNREILLKMIGSYADNEKFRQ